MKISQKTINQLIIMRLYGEIQAKHIKPLEFGFLRYSLEENTMIIDFTPCQFADESIVNQLDQLLRHLKSGQFPESLVVSSKLKEAQFKSFSQAIIHTGVNQPQSIAELFDLEEEHKFLENEKKELLSKSGGETEFHQILNQKKSIEWTLQVIKDSLDRDGKFYDIFSGELLKKKARAEGLEDTKKRILDHMKSKGVPC